jgi:hypothetical protein
MAMAITVTEKKAAKRKLRGRMKEFRVTIQDVAGVCQYHYNTVRDALNPETKYWNAEVVARCEQIITERQNVSV